MFQGVCVGVILGYFRGMRRFSYWVGVMKCGGAMKEDHRFGTGGAWCDVAGAIFGGRANDGSEIE